MKSETIKRKQKVRVGLVARKEYEGNLQVYAIKLQLCLLAVEGEVNKRTRERTQGEMKIWGREGHRGQFVRQTDRRLDGCAQRCSSSLTAQGEARLTPASHWHCILNHCDTSRSLSSLSLCGNSLTQLAPPLSSSRVIFTYYQETILRPLIVLPSSIRFPTLSSSSSSILAIAILLSHIILFFVPFPIYLNLFYMSTGFDPSLSFRKIKPSQPIDWLRILILIVQNHNKWKQTYTYYIYYFFIHFRIYILVMI